MQPARTQIYTEVHKEVFLTEALKDREVVGRVGHAPGYNSTWIPNPTVFPYLPQSGGTRETESHLNLEWIPRRVTHAPYEIPRRVTHAPYKYPGV